MSDSIYAHLFVLLNVKESLTELKLSSSKGEGMLCAVVILF